MTSLPVVGEVDVTALTDRLDALEAANKALTAQAGSVLEPDPVPSLCSGWR
jgi:hypothetical protein